MALTALTRRFSFRSVHSLNGATHRESRHGHQYFLEVAVCGDGGSEVAEIVRARILQQLDGHDLNQVLESATGERLVEWIHAQLDTTQLNGKIFAVAIQETRKNRFISASSDRRWT